MIKPHPAALQPAIAAESVRPQDRTLGDALRRQRAAAPDAPLFVTTSRRWTRAEADDTVNRIAQGLRAAGVERGQRVACLTRHGVECTLLLLAAARIGAVCAPLNWRLAAPEVEYVLGHSQARVLVVDREFLPALAGRPQPLLARVLVTDGSGELDGLALPGFEGWWSAFAPDDPKADGDWEDVALQLYSSGTTGLPKGVELTHEGLLVACRVYAMVMRIDAGSVMLNALPSFHIAGVENALTPLIEGGASVFQPQFDPGDVANAISRHRVTHAFLVPAMVLFLLQHARSKAADFGSLRMVSYGGSPAAETLLSEARRVLGCDLLQSYGMTEATGTMTWLLPEDHDPGGPRAHLLRSAGTPSPGVEVRIVESGSGRDLGEDEVGEVWVRTRQNMRGYWRHPQATDAAFPEGRDAGGGWMRTGDAGYRRDGYLYIHDRIKDMIVSGGENIYPAEVENALSAHPAVLECAVIGVPDDRWGEAVRACVVLRPGQDADGSSIIAWLRERLAHYKCPKAVDFVGTLPRNPSGKLLKRILREPYWAGRDRQVS